MKVVAGIGVRRAAASSEIVALVDRALGAAALGRGALAGLATAAPLAGADAFLEAARSLAVAPLAVDQTRLAHADRHVRTRSARSLAAHGVGSVAEAAALAGAGSGSWLVLERIASAGVTCALAAREGEQP